MPSHRVRRHLLLRPLPLNCATDLEETEEHSEEEESATDSSTEPESPPPANIEIWKKKRKEKQQRIREEEEERKEAEARERRKQRELENSHGYRKHKKKQKQPESDSEEEDSYKSVPHSEEFQHSQKHQRLHNHPTMAKPKKTTKKTTGGPKTGKANSKSGKSSSKKAKLVNEDSDGDTTAVSTLAADSGSEAQMKQARLEVVRAKLEKMMTECNEYLGKKSKTMSLLEARFHECAKKYLFKVVKYTNEAQIASHINWVIEYLNPQELEDFKEFPELCDKAVEKVHHVRCANAVRTGLNHTHNTKRSDFIKVFADMKESEWNPDNLPTTGKEIDDLILRKGMGDKDADHEAKIEQWANTIDILLPKVR